MDVNAPECKDIIVNKLLASELSTHTAINTDEPSSYKVPYVVAKSSAIMEEYADGSGLLKMKLVKADDKNSGWNVTLRLTGMSKYADFKNAGGIQPVKNVGDFYFANWRFYSYDVNGSEITGFGKFANKNLYFTSKSDVNEGVQIGFNRNISKHYTDVLAHVPITENEIFIGNLDFAIPVVISPVYDCQNVLAHVTGITNPAGYTLKRSDGSTGLSNNNLCIGYHEVQVSTPDSKVFKLHTEVPVPQGCKVSFPKEICADAADNDYNTLYDAQDKSCITLNGNGVMAYYYSDLNLQNLVKCLVVPTINNTLGSNSPYKLNKVGPFAAQYEGQMTAHTTGTHTFMLNADGETSVFFNNQLVWFTKKGNPAVTVDFPYDLVAGQIIDLKVVYKHSSGLSQVQFAWIPPQGTQKIIVPQKNLTSNKNNNCSQNLQVDAESRGTIIPGELHILPNPSHDYIKVDLTFNQEESGADLEIINMMEQSMIKQSCDIKGNEVKVQLPVADLAPGTYILFIRTTGGAVYQQKFIKQ